MAGQRQGSYKLSAKGSNAESFKSAHSTQSPALVSSLPSHNPSLVGASESSAPDSPGVNHDTQIPVTGIKKESSEAVLNEPEGEERRLSQERRPATSEKGVLRIVEGEKDREQTSTFSTSTYHETIGTDYGKSTAVFTEDDTGSVENDGQPKKQVIEEESEKESHEFDHPTLYLDDHGVLRHKNSDTTVTDVEFYSLGEELLHSLEEHVESKMMRQFGLKCFYMPSKEASLHSTLFVSEDYQRCDKVVVFVGACRGARPGVWSRSVLVRLGIQKGSMLPYFAVAQSQNYGIVVLNPSNTSTLTTDPVTGEKVKRLIPCSSTPEEHMVSAWDYCLADTHASKISFVCYAYGGLLTKHLLRERLPEIFPRFNGAVFIESNISVLDTDPNALQSMLLQQCIRWESSYEPFGSLISNDPNACVILSAAKKPSDHSNSGYLVDRLLFQSFNFLEYGNATVFATELARRLRSTRTKSAPDNADVHITHRQFDKLTVEDFELLKVIGKGAFGKVMLVRKKEGANVGEIFALKVLKKAAVFAKKQVDHTITERRILKEIKHPFIVDLRFAFQTDEKLYIVMDYYPGGSLFFHLRKCQRFSEGRARFYAAELLLALHHLHKYNIAYRDLKLENILMDAEGHVALTDFGLSKENVEVPDSVKTFCGTAEYIAPELLRGQGYGKAVDWWGFGILVYEMIAGRTPFYDKNRKRMFHFILHREVAFPPFFSENAKSLLVGLLKKSPSERLGFKGWEEIIDHPFFAEIDFDALMNKQVTPPFKPRVADEMDTGNVATVFTREVPQDTPVPRGQMDAKQAKAFEGFTYIPDSQLNVPGA